MNSEIRRISWHWFFFAAALEAGAAFVVLALIPSEGLSPFRLVLFGVLFLFFAFGIYFGLRPSDRLDSLAQPGFILAAALLALTVSLVLFFLRYLDPQRLLPIYARLSPLLWFFLTLSIQSALFLSFLVKGLHPDALVARKPLFQASLFVFCLLLSVLCFVSITRLGLTPDPAYWAEPGVPLQGWQFALALLAGFIVFCFSFSGTFSRRVDLLIPFAIWLFAVLLWLSVPIEVLRNGFYVQIDPPAHQPYPYSDAGYYDSMAHSLLIGHPYQGQVPTRPLYIVFLSILHLLFKEDYPLIIAGQTFVFALIPVVLYTLGRRLHSRAAGLTIAMFAIFREFSALWVSSETRVSNTKTLLVDLPTFLFLSVACLFALRWLERRDAKSAFLAGGTFGIFLLLRTQSFLVLPLLLALAVLVYGLRNRQWLTALLIFFLGILITVSPWLTHNYLKIGQFTFDAPFQYKVIASQYAYTGNLDIQNYDFENQSLARVLIDFTLKDPGFVFGFVSNHFLAGEIGGLLALPLIETYNGIFAPVNLYWLSWDGTLGWYNVLLVIFYLAVISIGLSAVWRRWRWAGLLPLAFNIGYALATAIGRFSGWRYDLPADWVAYFYFGIGFVEILGSLALMFGMKPNEEQDFNAKTPGRGGIFLSSQRLRAFALNSTLFKILLPFAFLFAFIGALPWLAELPAAPRYPDRSPAALEARLETVSGPLLSSGVQQFLSQPEAVITEGRLLYPRYFHRGAGIPSANAWPAYALRDFPRTGFLLLNQTFTNVLFPAADQRPFPHAGDAIVLGCQREDHIEARLIAFPETDTAYLSDLRLEPCTPD